MATTTEQDMQSHHQTTYQQQEQQRRPVESFPSTPQLLTLLILLPLGATLLLLAGITLAATMIGLLIAVPLLLLFSPIIVPSVATIALSVLGILTSGAFGVTGLASVLWLANYLRAVRPWEKAAAYLGRRIDESGLKIEHKAQEVVDASL